MPMEDRRSLSIGAYTRMWIDRPAEILQTIYKREASTLCRGQAAFIFFYMQ